MGNPMPFDAKKVMELAERIEAAEGRLATLKKARDAADHEYRSASVALSNLKSDLTKAVEINLDHSILHHPHRSNEIRGDL